MTDKTDDTAKAESKSIISGKYAGYKGAGDWLSEQITGMVMKTKTIEKVVKATEEGGKDTKTKETRPDGIDIDAMFDLAGLNLIDTTKYANQRDAHGFAGRFRMSLRNMLQRSIKARHGYYDLKNKWVKADADWLTAKGAPTEPTEKRTGEKIAKAKAKADEKTE